MLHRSICRRARASRPSPCSWWDPLFATCSVFSVPLFFGCLFFLTHWLLLSPTSCFIQDRTVCEKVWGMVKPWIQGTLWLHMCCVTLSDLRNIGELPFSCLQKMNTAICIPRLWGGLHRTLRQYLQTSHTRQSLPRNGHSWAAGPGVTIAQPVPDLRAQSVHIQWNSGPWKGLLPIPALDLSHWESIQVDLNLPAGLLCLLDVTRSQLRRVL